MSRSILQEAQDIVYKDAGGHDYGSFEQNMQDACNFTMVMTGQQMTIDMAFATLIGLKLAREKQVHRIDNMVDVCGYMAGWSDYKERQESKNGDTYSDNDGQQGRSEGSVPVGELP